jgi:hypothetical protein
MRSPQIPDAENRSRTAKARTAPTSSATSEAISVSVRSPSIRLATSTWSDPESNVPPPSPTSTACDGERTTSPRPGRKDGIRSVIEDYGQVNGYWSPVTL